MKTFRFLVLVTVGVIFFGCEGEIAERVCCGTFGSDELAGKWLVYERGYSPGFGYVIEEIPAFPRQTIQFNKGTVETTGEVFMGIKYYQILTDTATDTQYVAFYTKDPTIEQHPNSTYTFDVDNAVLKLYYRWCIEGCHISLKRVNE